MKCEPRNKKLLGAPGLTTRNPVLLANRGEVIFCIIQPRDLAAVARCQKRCQTGLCRDRSETYTLDISQTPWAQWMMMFQLQALSKNSDVLMFLFTHCYRSVRTPPKQTDRTLNRTFEGDKPFRSMSVTGRYVFNRAAVRFLPTNNPFQHLNSGFTAPCSARSYGPWCHSRTREIRAAILSRDIATSPETSPHELCLAPRLTSSASPRELRASSAELGAFPALQRLQDRPQGPPTAASTGSAMGSNAGVRRSRVRGSGTQNVNRHVGSHVVWKKGTASDPPMGFGGENHDFASHVSFGPCMVKQNLWRSLHKPGEPFTATRQTIKAD